MLYMFFCVLYGALAWFRGLLTSTVPKILRELTVDDFKSQVLP